MLKSLIGKIKSEKASSVSPQKEQHFQNDEARPSTQPLQNYLFKSIGEDNVIKSPLKTIRYSVEPQAPEVYTSILACPISVFNVLPFGKRKVKEIDLTNDPCPLYIASLKEVLSEELPTFNHLLINVYPPGVGIMPHFDGPMYKPKVVVLSLGGPSIINFYDSYASKERTASVLLEDKSVHIFQGEAYEGCLHGIQDYSIDSIFLKITRQKEQETISIENASVSNFHQTYLSKNLTIFLQKNLHPLKQPTQLDLSPQFGFKGSLLPVKDNPDYNYKLEITRQQRISITIREKLS